MQMKFFWIPMRGSLSEETELNQFLSQHQIGNVERVFYAGQGPGWSVCVEFIPSKEPAAKKGNQQVDYKETLDPDTFQIYAALRAWRNSRAEELGIQRYAIASNEQLAGIAQKRMHTRNELAKLDGFGDIRMEKYGDGLIECAARSIDSLEKDGGVK